eukprot:gnl/TRDRNA2_/TRDRNA2_175728_c1_seq4.p1 gnl/TRDRNA2_/TRDRNA2_175728_c1~~gnl/TRDRNA2_/TRDRNA2_175728_c1_seq4.p1  ORF type:complete len:272 (-),score=29.13 gnl/TRDRNA2_/TRDRNA2_175728_c1_seq4:278-1093(-)
MAQAIFGLSHLRSSLPAAAFAHLVPPRIASSIIVPSYRPQLMMQPSTMVWMAAFLLFAAVDVNGEAHAECEKAGMEIGTVKAADGTPCFGSRRLSALLPDLQYSSPFQGRRLQSGMEDIERMCEPNCKAGLDKYHTACAPHMSGEDVEGIEGILGMCKQMKDPCFKNLMPMMTGECDIGKCPPEDGMECKLCTASDSCKANACAMISSCDANKSPTKDISASDWKEGFTGFTDSVKDCPCPAAADTTSGGHLHTASFGVMLLLAFLIFLQQ